ncbi:MAG: hypothetical protein AAGF60_08600 [Pseudomonadota bacterium]
MIRLAFLALLPVAAAAQEAEVFVPPEGCTGTLTVQSANCQVSNIYVCDADVAGHNWRMVFDREGALFLSKIDAETQWLESYDFDPGRRNVLRQPADDPARLTELLETGTDSYDFVQSMGGDIVRIVGFDRLTGDDAVIDGEPLLGTEFSARYEGFSGTYLRVEGREYVSVRHRRFIGGTITRIIGDTRRDEDQSPVEFVYPGEPGFFTQTPLYGCAAQVARFDVTGERE